MEITIIRMENKLYVVIAVVFIIFSGCAASSGAVSFRTSDNTSGELSGLQYNYNKTSGEFVAEGAYLVGTDCNSAKLVGVERKESEIKAELGIKKPLIGTGCGDVMTSDSYRLIIRNISPSITSITINETNIHGDKETHTIPLDNSSNKK